MFDRWRGRYVEDPVDPSIWTVRLTIGHRVGVPLTLADVLDEDDCVATVKAWLANLNEDGTPPENWDGWLQLTYWDHGVDGVLVFQPGDVTSFECHPGGVEE